MARNDVHLFASFFKQSEDGIAVALSSNTLKLGFVNNTLVPTVGMADPRWGSGGSNNFAANEVAHGTSYMGPIALTGVTYTRTGGIITLDANDMATIARDTGGFTNGYYAILYDDTVSGKYAIGWLDLGGPISQSVGSITIYWNVDGVFTKTVT